jgi:NADPH:quinone reductase-like Zn-dependent oxidoreductase
MAKMRVAQIARSNGPFEIVEREIPEPAAGQVRIKVEACGICHSDSMTKEGLWPGIQYPRVPGHEVAGIIDVLGTDVTGWKQGQRVGVKFCHNRTTTWNMIRRPQGIAAQFASRAGDSTHAIDENSFLGKIYTWPNRLRNSFLNL